MKYDDLPMLVRDCALESFRTGVYEMDTKDLLLRLTRAYGYLIQAIMDDTKDEVERWSAEMFIQLIDVTYVVGTDIEECLRRRVTERMDGIQLLDDVGDDDG